MDDTVASAISRGRRPGGEQQVEFVSGISPGAKRIWVERPDPDGAAGAWCYTDRRSYRPGDQVSMFVSSTEPRVQVDITIDDGRNRQVLDTTVNTRFQPVPDAAYRDGCGWDVSLTYGIPWDADPGAYLVTLRSVDSRKVLGHHLFVVRPVAPRKSAIALVLSTATWTAYNDWGGASHYYGIHPASVRGRSPELSTQRPWARGQIWVPPGAPRIVNERRPDRPLPPRYESAEWAYMHGFSKYYASTGWATYERHFVHWAERHGYVVDLLTQDDLHFDDDPLGGYRCAVFVGHDEYWTEHMRRVVDAFVDGGGNIARFAGNFMWQIRLDQGGERQIAHKYDAREADPLRTFDRSAVTTAWEDSWVGYPGAKTFGVNALRGMYAGFGAMAPRAARGFVTFRPRHWAFAGTGLGYADMFGDESNVFGFEMDGVEYQFVDGLPEPTHADGAPAGLQILAMNWATSAEDGLDEYRDDFMLGDADAQFRAHVTEQTDAAGRDRARRTSGMVVYFERGSGRVFTAATCEWVCGLMKQDYYIETVTHNVLREFLAESADATP